MRKLETGMKEWEALGGRGVMVLKGPKHDQVEGEFVYIKQTRMVR
jgi:hypothetical protein